MSGKERDALNAWIENERAAKRWVAVCLSCGAWFSKARKGKPAIQCGRWCCELWFKYRLQHGLPPPTWLKMKWWAAHGDLPRARRPLNGLKFFAAPNPHARVAA